MTSAKPIVRGPDDGDRIYAGGDLDRFPAVKEESERQGTEKTSGACLSVKGTPPR